jgi:hypothetical protein
MRYGFFLLAAVLKFVGGDDGATTHQLIQQRCA